MSFQMKLHAYSSYVVGARIDDSDIMPGLYFDTTDPYYYLRVQDWPGKRYAVFGGADHNGDVSRPQQTVENVERLGGMGSHRYDLFLDGQHEGGGLEHLARAPPVPEIQRGQMVGTLAPSRKSR